MCAQKTIEQILSEAERQLSQNRAQMADDLLRSFLEVANEQELRLWEVDIRKTIKGFLPKRQKSLTELLELRIEPKRATSPPPRKPATSVASPAGPNLSEVGAELRLVLSDLSENHIFQWATFYRDNLFPIYKQLLDVYRRTAKPAEVAEFTADALSGHAQEIFEKGLKYLRQTSQTAPNHAVQKGIGGLQRFLEVPVEFYSTEVRHIANPLAAKALRVVTSAFLRGIMTGFGEVKYFGAKGASYFHHYPSVWTHYLGFMTQSDCEDIVGRMEGAPLGEAIARVVVPVLGVIDEFAARDSEYHPLPVLGQYFRDQGRLEISLLPPPDSDAMQNVEIDCVLEAEALSKWGLLEAASRNASVLVTELRPDLESVVQEHETLRKIVVALDDKSSPAKARNRVKDVLEMDLYRRVSPRAAQSPLTYNFARDFPLHNPFLTQYFRVRRQSVRNLLRTFERRNGVRVWCSIRRSGKTTACFDLGSTAGGDLVISQTCDSTEQTPGASFFYEAVRGQVSSGADLSASFVEDTIESCATHESSQNRCVFILDEYETLFGLLKTSVVDRPAIRYTTVQPLLNQLVAYSRDNLIVLLGQQPDAHFILMDQNQLSAYVEQDAFPLFTHEEGSKEGEFAELVSKVLTERVVAEASFLDELYGESAGHPYLTVKLLVIFVEWMIETGRKVGELRLSGSDFRNFASVHLTARRVAQNKEYEFFRQAVSQAISKNGRTETPWLHAAYMIVRQIALDSPETLSLSYAEVEEFVRKSEFEELGFTVDQLLSTASQSNFVVFDGAHVKPAVRILSRIAAGSRGKVR